MRTSYRTPGSISVVCATAKVLGFVIPDGAKRRSGTLARTDGSSGRCVSGDPGDRFRIQRGADPSPGQSHCDFREAAAVAGAPLRFGRDDKRPHAAARSDSAYFLRIEGVERLFSGPKPGAACDP